MPSPRTLFTVRRMMFAIAALAVILGGSIEAIRLKRTHDEFRKIAAEHARRETDYRQAGKSYAQMAQMVESFLHDEKSLLERLEGHHSKSPGQGLRSGAFEELQSKLRNKYRSNATNGTMEREEAARSAELAEYHATLKRKYLRAAARPWLSVEPDPPPPDPAGRGRYWAERGEYIRARSAYEEAIGLDPLDFFSMNDLAWSLATCPDANFRDGGMAVQLATRACELAGQTDAAFLDTLAAARAEAGDFKSAVKSQSEAIGNLAKGDPLLGEYQNRLRLYESSKPYRAEVSKKQK